MKKKANPDLDVKFNFMKNGIFRIFCLRKFAELLCETGNCQLWLTQPVEKVSKRRPPDLGSNTTRMVNGFPSGQLYFDFDTTHLPPRIASKSGRKYCVVHREVTMIPSRIDNP